MLSVCFSDRRAGLRHIFYFAHSVPDFCRFGYFGAAVCWSSIFLARLAGAHWALSSVILADLQLVDLQVFMLHARSIDDYSPNQALQATAGKRLGWQVGRQRPAVPELGR